MPNELKGYLLVAAAAFFWGLTGAVAKYFFNQALSPLVLVTVRLSLSGLILLLIIFFRHPRLLYLHPGDIGKMFIFGIAGMSCVQFLYLYTISQLNVATAVFLQYLGPAFIVLFAVFWNRERLSRHSLSALLMAMGGSALIVAGQSLAGLSGHWAGLLTGFLSALAMSFYVIYGKVLLSHYNSWVVLGYGLLFGAIPFWFLEPPWVIYGLHYSGRIWLFFGYIVIFSTLVPFGLAFMGLRYLKPAPAGIIMMLEPVIAGIAAYLLLGEVLGGWQLAGCCLILAAVVILNLEQQLAGASYPSASADDSKIPVCK